ncbi:carotenoid oxygenase family protein [Emcibacter nanhaiensis]|uniref:Dioxygenase n=1 Tax=Emcibacter nanhaiensis TaxID=1505037 RepID=A0A501PD50_9PROT|nr:carotenoid oxygenase family protein [Emcibacter nanhaiensis]TPD57886.1 carotenoid oxygenase family protein [Emcibacter nanhaiensis]
MKQYPDTPDFTGINAPIGEEYSLKNLEVEGEIPAEVRGAFYRAVPDPAFPPMFEDDTALSGDGMLSRLYFGPDGQVDFDIRFVETARHQAEVAAGKALFGRYRNPFTDDPSVDGVDRTVANTTPVWHGGRLLMTKEDGRAYEMNPHTLETLGSYDFGGVLKSETMTAHVRIDPATKEMFFFGYEADGLASSKVAYCIADREGTLTHEQWFDVPYCSMMHDFVITENYAVFPVYPTTADLERLKAGGDHWVHHMDLESWVGIMPRYGDVSEMRWFRGPKGVSTYHMMNCFEDEEGRVHMDHCMSNCNAFPFIQRASGLNVPPQELGGGLIRWTMDMTGSDDNLTQVTLGPPGDMPRIADKDQGRPYQRGWYLSVNPELKGPPLMGGVVGAEFNLLLRIEPDNGRIDAYAFPPLSGIHEPVHVPSARDGHEGWLISFVDMMQGEDDLYQGAWIFDAGNVAAGPVAKITIPHRLRPQVHGWWVPQAELDKSVRK